MRITCNIPEFTRNERNSHCETGEIGRNAESRPTVRQKDASETERESIQNSDQASNAIRVDKSYP